RTPGVDVPFPGEFASEASQGTIQAAFLDQTTESDIHGLPLGPGPGQAFGLLNKCVIDFDIRPSHSRIPSSDRYTNIRHFGVCCNSALADLSCGSSRARRRVKASCRMGGVEPGGRLEWMALEIRLIRLGAFL